VPDIPVEAVSGKGMKLGISQAAAQLWTEALQETRARQAPQIRPSREWFEQLPTINRFLLGSGGVCLLAGLFCLIGIPLLGSVNSSVRAAVYPYTSEGKRETCLSNLQHVGAALAQYSQDHDGRYPLAEYKSGGKRWTWMAQLRERGLEAEAFVCPAGAGGDLETTGSYGMNPAFGGQALTDETSADQTGRIVLLADRGEDHDSILLPPFAGWPSPKAESGVEKGNFAANHGDSQVAVLYADGHAGVKPISSGTADAASWGGPLLVQASLKRLEAQYPLLTRIESTSSLPLVSQHENLRQGLEQLRLLAKQNQDSGVNETIDKRLWRGADILDRGGNGQLHKQLTDDLLLHLKSTMPTGSDWQRHESERGFALQHPTSWSVGHEQDGRYHRTTFRSPSPHLYTMIEAGERTRPTEATTIDWTGMEISLKKQFGRNYQRITMGRSTLGGREVSVWECTMRKPDGPWIRKRYVGYSSTWNSVIFVTAAPADAWDEWIGSFHKIAQSFEFTD
jgi:hypothetical protein